MHNFSACRTFSTTEHPTTGAHVQLKKERKKTCIYKSHWYWDQSANGVHWQFLKPLPWQKWTKRWESSVGVSLFLLFHQSYSRAAPNVRKYATEIPLRFHLVASQMECNNWPSHWMNHHLGHGFAPSTYIWMVLAVYKGPCKVIKASRILTWSVLTAIFPLTVDRLQKSRHIQVGHRAWEEKTKQNKNISYL